MYYKPKSYLSLCMKWWTYILLVYLVAVALFATLQSNQISPSLGHAWANFLRSSMIITSFVLNRLTKHFGSHPAGSNWKQNETKKTCYN